MGRRARRPAAGWFGWTRGRGSIAVGQRPQHAREANGIMAVLKRIPCSASLAHCLSFMAHSSTYYTHRVDT